MSLVDPSHPLVKLVRKDTRYSLDGYLFVLESLTFAQQSLGMGEEAAGENADPLAAAHGATEAVDPPAAKRTRAGRTKKKAAERHLTGQQLCEAARVYAMRQYGYLAKTVLGSWGITRTDDIGEIVYNMIAIGQMRKTRTDRREDFNDVYDFDEALSREYSFASPEAEA
jgi:uncharacterized repeat protein (TIGR04138 family)